MKDNRTCRRCGQSVEDENYVLWLFHACQACAAERAPQRWGDVGTYKRKWGYFPRWHMTRHPDLPEAARTRAEART